MGFEFIVLAIVLAYCVSASAVYNPDVVRGRVVKEATSVTKRDEEILEGKTIEVGEKKKGWILDEEKALNRLYYLRKEVADVEREIAQVLGVIKNPGRKDIAYAQSLLAELKAEKRRLVGQLSHAKEDEDVLVETNPVLKALKKAGLK